MPGSSEASNNPTEPLPLIINRLVLKDYRGFEGLQVEFGNFNVLIGINGSGKTSILRALATVASRLSSRLIKGRQGGIQISESDIRNGKPYATVAGGILYQHGDFFNASVRQKTGARSERLLPDVPGLKAVDGDRLTQIADFALLADALRGPLLDDAQASLPVLVYYPVDRAVLDIPLRVRGKQDFDQFDAYNGAYDTTRSFRTFFEWFRAREDLENEHRIGDSDYRDVQLEAVRSAIEQFMPGYKNLRIRRHPLRMTLEKESETVLVNQLSDGEKAILSLVGDLARRLAIANPGRDQPLRGCGVVFVDEIDLHLHPGLQRIVIQRLTDVFRNIQFFLTTHSPVVASSAPNGSLYILDRSGIRSVDTYGQEVSLVLDEVFGVAPRDPAVQVRLDRLFETIEADTRAAEPMKAELIELLGPHDPDLIRADARIRRKMALQR